MIIATCVCNPEKSTIKKKMQFDGAATNSLGGRQMIVHQREGPVSLLFYNADPHLKGVLIVRVQKTPQIGQQIKVWWSTDSTRHTIIFVYIQLIEIRHEEQSPINNESY